MEFEEVLVLISNCYASRLKNGDPRTGEDTQKCTTSPRALLFMRNMGDYSATFFIFYSFLNFFLARGEVEKHRYVVPLIHLLVDSCTCPDQD